MIEEIAYLLVVEAFAPEDGMVTMRLNNVD
jgi:hypothetical protein